MLNQHHRAFREPILPKPGHHHRGGEGCGWPEGARSAAEYAYPPSLPLRLERGLRGRRCAAVRSAFFSTSPARAHTMAAGPSEWVIPVARPPPGTAMASDPTQTHQNTEKTQVVPSPPSDPRAPYKPHRRGRTMSCSRNSAHAVLRPPSPAPPAPSFPPSTRDGRTGREGKKGAATDGRRCWPGEEVNRASNGRPPRIDRGGLVPLPPPLAISHPYRARGPFFLFVLFLGGAEPGDSVLGLAR